MTKLLISVITPNFNGEKYLKTCLGSLLKTSYSNFEVILVDDGSNDNSLQIIREFRKRDKRIIFIQNSKNIGAAASRNRAIKRAKGEIIVFLDNDTEVDKDWLGELIKPLIDGRGIGASQALLLDFEQRDVIQMAGGQLIPQTGWLIPFNQGQRYSTVKNRQIERNIVAISACLAVKREVVEEIGGFDEKEAIYTEDLDFCWRVWIAGYKIVLAPKSIVYHRTKLLGERAKMKASYKQIYFHLAKNSFRSIIKNYEAINLVRFLAASIAVNFARGVLVLVRRKDFSALSGTLSGILWNLLDFPNTISERIFVQRTRKFSDDFLMSEIFEKKSLIEIYNKSFRRTKLLW